MSLSFVGERQVATPRSATTPSEPWQRTHYFAGVCQRRRWYAYSMLSNGRCEMRVLMPSTCKAWTLSLLHSCTLPEAKWRHSRSLRCLYNGNVLRMLDLQWRVFTGDWRYVTYLLLRSYSSYWLDISLWTNVWKQLTRSFMHTCKQNFYRLSYMPSLVSLPLKNITLLDLSWYNFVLSSCLNIVCLYSSSTRSLEALGFSLGLWGAPKYPMCGGTTITDAWRVTSCPKVSFTSMLLRYWVDGDPNAAKLPAQWNCCGNSHP